MNTLVRILATSCLAGFIAVVVVSCGAGKKVTATAEEGKVQCEAYLFDTKIDRKGKQNSMRLEIYQTPGVLGLNGRAYLGKGALRGKLTADSLAIYLPHTNEYIYEPVDSLLAATECSLDSVSLDITKYFVTTPDSIPHDPRVKIAVDRHEPKYPVYTIFAENCQWQMQLIYDHGDKGWRILKFAFTDGKDLTMLATRREYKASTSVKPDRLQFSHPDDAQPTKP